MFRLRSLFVSAVLLSIAVTTFAQDAQLPRVLPPGFPALPIMPAEVSHAGAVSYTDSLLNVYLRTYGAEMTGGVAFVSPAGSDTTGVINSLTLPYATIAYPLRKTSAQLIVLMPGAYDPSDFEATDSGGGTPKAVVCLVAGSCTVRVLGGDALSQNTWEPAGGGVYETHIASDGVTTGAPQRILRNDATDANGFPARIAMYGSLSALQTGGTGWFYDSAAHMLYVALGGRDVRRDSCKLRALYFTRAGNAHIWLGGVTVLFEGIAFEGISFDAIETEVSGVYQPTHLWITDFVQSFGAEFGFWDIGSTVYAQNGVVHANKVDGFNGNWSRAGLAGNADVMLEANIFSSDAGDVATFGYGGPTLDNGSSSHNGYIASFGSIYERDWGPEFADTSSEDIDIPSVTWLVGSIARNSNPADTDNYGGFQFKGVQGTPSDGDPRNRVVWMDTCASGNERGAELDAEDYAVVHLFNSPFREAHPGVGALPFQPYVPSDPH